MHMAAALGLALALAGHAEAAAVANGPMLTALSPAAATIWVRLDAAAHVRVRYKLQGAAEWSYADAGDAVDAGDFAVKVALKPLQANHLYSYSIGISQAGGGETWSPESWFRSQKAKPASLGFTVLSDFANGGKASAALASAAATRPEFLAVIGDMDHRGPAVDPATNDYYPPEDWPTVLGRMRSMHRMMRDPKTPIGAQMVAGLVASTAERPQIPFLEVWDDHDYCANNSDASCPFRAQAFQAWREYFAWPKDSGLGTAGCGGEGVYQRTTYGDIAAIFMLDARSNRAPTNDEHPATMLGECQLAWLIHGLQATPAVWKIILSPVPFNPGTKTWDAWSMFNDGPMSDRQRLLAAIHDNDIRNVVVISGDIHTGGAIDDGTHSGLPEVSSPHANLVKTLNTYCQRQQPDGTLVSQPGTWTLGGLVDPNIGVVPPQCLGNAYAGIRIGPVANAPVPLDGHGAPGFVRVDATAATASLQILDDQGQPRTGFRADGSQAVMRIDLVAQ
jgi:alkaline phosphatase D